MTELITPNMPRDHAPQRLALDLRHYAHKQRHGDIMVHLTWLITDGDPCIVLTPAFAREHFDAITPCIVPLQSAWLWDEHLGDKARTNSTAATFAAHLGFPSHDVAKRQRIKGIIRSYLADLVAMPVITEDGIEVVADLFHTDPQTGKTRHVEVKGYDNV